VSVGNGCFDYYGGKIGKGIYFPLIRLKLQSKVSNIVKTTHKKNNKSMMEKENKSVSQRVRECVCVCETERVRVKERESERE